MLSGLAHFLPVCLKSGSQVSRSQCNKRLMIISMNHIKMNLLIRRSRAGLMVRRKFLQRLPLEKTVRSDLNIHVVKFIIKSHGAVSSYVPSFSTRSDGGVQFCKHILRGLLCFLFSFPPSSGLFPSSEATTLKGSLSKAGPSLLLEIGLHLCIPDELRFLNK